MKFCYVDESGTGDKEPVVVYVGVVADAYRMHVSKAEWAKFLDELPKVPSKSIDEIHTYRMYRGRDEWYGVSSETRTALMDSILAWLTARKHKFTFGAVEKSRYSQEDATLDGPSEAILRELRRDWPKTSPSLVALLHVLCSVQRQHQKEKKNKGHTVLVMDGDTRPHAYVYDWHSSPPPFTDTFYRSNKKLERFDQLIDVPYYGDSERVHLLQVADLLAFIIRFHAELQADLRDEKYHGEKDQVAKWFEQALKSAYPRSSRWDKCLNARSDAEKFFWSLAPEPLRGM